MMDLSSIDVAKWPHWVSPGGEVLLVNADVRAALQTLPSESVNCCVTSPPYWGLRDYGTATWEGGSPDCNHRKGKQESRLAKSTLGGATCTQNHSQEPSLDSNGNCRKCGAKRIDRQLGLETTPEQYVASMVEVFREVRRILRDDGTLWLNLGDSYNANGWECRRVNSVGNGSMKPEERKSGKQRNANLKVKDLVGIPWRVAFALQADGWYLRSDIIWSKPNPMPESVTDRPTKAHEYLFLLSKSERYFYDAEAIKEEAVLQGTKQTFARPCRSARAFGSPSGSELHADRVHDVDGRNKRTVWTIASQPYPDAHFATFPPKLIEPCILAGCPVGGVVLEPFAGSGTTLAVAVKHQRNAIGTELNPAYVELAKRRCEEALAVGSDSLFREVLTNDLFTEAQP